MHDSGVVETRKVPPEPAGHSGGDGTLVREFSRCIFRGDPSPTLLEAGMDSVLACLAARESAQTRRFVEVAPY